MKSTIKLSAGKAIVIEQAGEGIRVDLTMFGVSMGADVLTLDQAGALVSALEFAADQAEKQQARAA